MILFYTDKSRPKLTDDSDSTRLYLTFAFSYQTYIMKLNCPKRLNIPYTIHLITLLLIFFQLLPLTVS